MWFVFQTLTISCGLSLYMFNDGDAGDDDDGNGSKPPDLTKKRKRFSAEEDRLLKALVDGNRQKSWDQIAREIPGRTARQCRDRYNNYLFKEISGASWKPTEDEIILKMHKEIGPKWSLIAKQLVGRSGNNVKNRWYKFLSKQKHNHTPLLSSYSVPQPESVQKPEICVQVEVSNQFTSIATNDFPHFHHSPVHEEKSSDSEPDETSFLPFPLTDIPAEPFDIFAEERIHSFVDDWDAAF